MKQLKLCKIFSEGRLTAKELLECIFYNLTLETTLRYYDLAS